MDLHLNDFATVAEYNAFIEGDYLKPNVSYIEEIGGVKYQKDAPDPAKQYFTTIALEDSKFQLSGDTTNTIDYSLDGGSTWTTLAANTDTPTVTAGTKIMWKGTLTPTSNAGIGTIAAGPFYQNYRFSVEGNVMSLLYGDNFIGQTDLTGKDYAFKSLLSNNGKLIDAGNLILPATTLSKECYQGILSDCNLLVTAPAILPATTLTEFCYYAMFNNCTSLTTAPALPATTLAQSCYEYMFQGCTSLTTAPALPATTLANSCYSSMFQSCSSLNSIKMLATDISAMYCLLDWVNGVAATGTFVKDASMTGLSTGKNGIPSGWTVQDA